MTIDCAQIMHRDRATAVFTRQRSSPDGFGKAFTKSVGHNDIRPRQHSHSESEKTDRRLTLVPDLDGSRPTVHMVHPEHIKKIAVTRADKPNIFYEFDQV